MKDEYDENQWKKDGRTIYIDLITFYDIKKYLEDKINEEKKIKGTDENLQMIEELLEEINNEVVPLADEINQKTKYYTLPQEEIINQESKEIAPQGNLMIQNLVNNQEVLEERRKQLESIHQTSAQIKDMSDAIIKQLNEQGVILDDAETKIKIAEDNSKKAKEEITKADQFSKGNRKKLFCIIAIIIVVFIGIVAILLSLYL